MVSALTWCLANVGNSLELNEADAKSKTKAKAETKTEAETGKEVKRISSSARARLTELNAEAGRYEISSPD